MLTIEMLRQSSALSGLTDAQLTAIAEMSRNDENTTIGARIGALHGQYDTDIFNITGINKKEGEKSYDYAKRVLGEYKAKAESVKTIQAQLTAAQTKVTELQAKLENNAGDETLKQQLKDTKTQVSQLQAKLQTTESTLAESKAKYDKDLKDVHMNYAFQAATAGLKFKSGITEALQRTLLSAAKSEILSKGSLDFVDDGKGGQTLVIRGADGNILNNPKNNLNPYTIGELVMETSLKDAIDTGRQQTGGGTGPGAGTGAGANETLDMSGVKTQLDADKVIEGYLLSKGLTRDSDDFAAQSMQLRDENNVANLPLR